MSSVSFISEHSAEFILVPRVVSFLEESFSRICPIYFWSSREGSRLSYACDSQQPVRVLSIFARRPKIVNPNQDSLGVKINIELFDYAKAASEFGIQTFAGVPRITSIFDASITAPCTFFRLLSADQECLITLSRRSGRVIESTSMRGLQVVRDGLNFAEMALENCEQKSWGEMIEAIRELRKAGSSNYHPFYGSYRPFHLILIDRD